MRTVREVLMAEHAGVEGRLDALRERVVGGELAGRESLWWRMWSELVLPCRRVWVGLAMVWVVVVGLHLGARGEGVRLGGRGVGVMGEVERAVLVEQAGMRCELLGLVVQGDGVGGAGEGVGPRSEAVVMDGMNLVMMRMRERGEA